MKTEQHAYKKIENDIRNNSLRPPLFFYGREQYLIQWAVASIIKEYVEPAARELDFSKLDATNLRLEELINHCETLPMFSSKRVVLVDKFAPLAGNKLKTFTENDEAVLDEYIKTLPEKCILIFTEETADKRRRLFKSVSSIGTCYEFKALDEKQLMKFVEKRFIQSGKRIKPSLINEMICLSGYYDKETDYTLYNLENDIKKAIALSEGMDIQREDINMAVTGNNEAYVFDMIDALSNSKKGEAFLLLNSLLSTGESIYKLLALICSQLEILLMVKEMREDGFSFEGIKKELGIHEFRIKKAISIERRYSVTKLRSILCHAYQIDKNIKSGLLDSRLALELLIAEM